VTFLRSGCFSVLRPTALCVARGLCRPERKGLVLRASFLEDVCYRGSNSSSYFGTNRTKKISTLEAVSSTAETSFYRVRMANTTTGKGVKVTMGKKADGKKVAVVTGGWIESGMALGKPPKALC